MANVLFTCILLAAIGRVMFVLHWSPEKRPRSSFRDKSDTKSSPSIAARHDLWRDRITTTNREAGGGWHPRQVGHAWASSGRDDSPTRETLEWGDKQVAQYPQPMARQRQNDFEPSQLSSWDGRREGGKEPKWGSGKKVLIFTMDSLEDTVARAKLGGPAGEIKIRESLIKSLTEAGVQVMLSRSVSSSPLAPLGHFYCIYG